MADLDSLNPEWKADDRTYELSCDHAQFKNLGISKFGPEFSKEFVSNTIVSCGHKFREPDCKALSFRYVGAANVR